MSSAAGPFPGDASSPTVIVASARATPSCCCGPVLRRAGQGRGDEDGDPGANRGVRTACRSGSCRAGAVAVAAHCRSCGAPLATLFVDRGPSPISNAFRTAEELGKPETFYPLRAYVCDVCWLVQLDDVAGREAHFNADYAYFSS